MTDRGEARSWAWLNGTAALLAHLLSACAAGGPPGPPNVEGRGPTTCDPEADVQKIFYGDGTANYLDLGPRQQQAIGLLSVDCALSRWIAFNATMVAPRFVVTAAHCQPPANLDLVFTVKSPDDVELASWPAIRFVEHPSLDLAVVELDVSAVEVYSVLEPIPLTDEAWPIAGQLALLAGFGLTEADTLGERKFVAELVVEDEDHLDDIVVDGFGRTGACVGDSGGPLLIRDEEGRARVTGVLYQGSADCIGRDRYLPVSEHDALFAELPSQCATVACGEIDGVGRCFSGTAVYCDGGTLRGEPCGPGTVCGFSPEAQGYRCLPPQLDPCSGADTYGRCGDGAALHCEQGTLRGEDCGALGQSCVLSGEGRAVCIADPL